MNIYSIPAIIAFTINFSLTLLSLLDRPSTSIKRWFSAFVGTFAVWNISEIIILNNFMSPRTLEIAQILYGVIFLSPAIFLILSDKFLPLIRRPHLMPWMDVVVILVPILILGFSYPTFKIQIFQLPGFVNAYYYRISINSSLAFYSLLIVSSVYMIAGTLILYEKYRLVKSTSDKARIAFLWVGVLMIFVAYLFINLFHQRGFKASSFYFFSTTLTLFISFFFYYAVMHRKIFRLSKILSGGLTYTIISSFLVTVYFLVIREMTDVLSKMFGVQTFWFEALLIFSVVMLIYPLKMKVQYFVDKLVYKHFNEFKRNFLNFSQSLLEFYDNDRLISKVGDFLRENFGLERVYIFCLNEGKHFFSEMNGLSEVVFFEDDSMVKILSRIRSSLEFYDLKESFFSSEQYDFLIKIKAAVFVPIFSDQQLVCFMILPEKRGDKAYNYEELMLLNIFINEVSNVFMRNMIIEGVKRKEQEKARMERLASLGQLTATVAHEIRNPLNTISMSAETLLKRDLNKEDEQELLEYILEETGRLNRILTDFLRLSSVPEPHITEVDMEEFEQEVDRYIRTHLDCDIEYELVRSESFAKAYMDHNIVYEIILNLVGNAIDALCEQKQVEGRKLRVVFKQVKEYYIFAVEDNGRRIRPEEREKIFEPFYTTKPRGTGLGLSISVNLARVLSGELRLNIYQNKKRFILIIPKFDSNGKRV